VPGVSKAERNNGNVIRFEKEVKKGHAGTRAQSYRDEAVDTSFFAVVMLEFNKGDGKANASKVLTLTSWGFGSSMRIRSPRAEGDSECVADEWRTGTRGPFGRIVAI
jgi:hypothetical protein